MDDEWFATDLLGMDTCGIGEPVVGVDDVVFLLTSYDTCYDGIVVDFVLEVVGIFARELYAAEVIGLPIVKVGVDVVAQCKVLLWCHFVADAFLHVLVVYVFPYDGHLAHPDDVHEAFVFVSPWRGDAECDVHVGNGCKAFCDAVAGCAQTAEDMRWKLPPEH